MDTIRIYPGTMANFGFALFSISCIMQHTIGAFQAPVVTRGQGTAADMEPSPGNKVCTAFIRCTAFLLLLMSMGNYYSLGTYSTGTVVCVGMAYLYIATLYFKVTFPILSAKPSRDILVPRWGILQRDYSSYIVFCMLPIVQYLTQQAGGWDPCKLSTWFAIFPGLFCTAGLHPLVSDWWGRKGHNIDGDLVFHQFKTG